MAFPNSIDEGALFFFLHSHRPKLDTAMKYFTELGNRYCLAVGLALGCLLLWKMKRAGSAFLLVLCLVSAVGFTYGTKQLVRRDRPSEAKAIGEKPTNPYCFPSGYALESMALYLALGMMLSRDAKSGWAKRATLPCFLLAFLIGVSRLYIGYNYVFDVIGAWMAGIAIALLFYWIDLQVASVGTVDVDVLPPESSPQTDGL